MTDEIWRFYQGYRQETLKPGKQYDKFLDVMLEGLNEVSTYHGLQEGLNRYVFKPYNFRRMGSTLVKEVAVLNNEIVGYGNLFTLAKPPSKKILTVFSTSVYVKPEYRNHGLYRQIISDLYLDAQEIWATEQQSPRKPALLASTIIIPDEQHYEDIKRGIRGIIQNLGGKQITPDPDFFVRFFME